MPRVTQLNLRVENQTGRLSRLCRDLALGGVNLLGLTAPRTDGTMGVISLLVANPEVASRALEKAGYQFEAEEVLFLEIKNRPGALARITEKLERANIGIRDAYATAYPKAQKTAAVIAVDRGDLIRAERLLSGQVARR